MQKSALLLSLAASLVLTGCVTTWDAQKTTVIPTSVGIIHNPKVRVAYALPSIQRSLLKHDIESVVCETEEACKDQDFILKYVAYHTWDIAMYLKEAELWLYQDGKLIGTSKLHTYPWNLTKWANNEERMENLVDELLGKKIDK